MIPLKKREAERQGPEPERDEKREALMPTRALTLSYTPMPELSGGTAVTEAPKRFPWWAVALALALAGGGFLVGTHFAAGSAYAPVVQNIDDNRITPSAPDLDPDATKAAREQLARGDTPAALRGASDQTLRDLREGRTALYKVFLYAPAAPAGAHVVAEVGGAMLGDIPLASGGTVQIPLAQGVVQTLTLSVVSASQVVVHAKTSTGADVTKPLSGGDRVQWDVVLR